MRLVKAVSRLMLFAITGIVIFHITGCDDDKSRQTIIRVSVSASDSAAVEGTPSEPGVFDVELSSTSETDVVVNYRVTGSADGSDHNLSSGTITIPAGSRTAQLVVLPVEDNLEELAETVIVTLEDGSGYSLDPATSQKTADVTIAANDTPEVTITATDSIAMEIGDDAEFSVSLSTVPMVDKSVNYTLSGSAQNGADYALLSGEIIIPAGGQTGTIAIVPLEDDFEEGIEDVVLTLAEGAGYTVGANDTVTATIDANDTPTVEVSASDAYSAESGNEGSYLFKLSAIPMEEKLINYSMSNTAVNGVDYIALSGTLIVDAGEASKELALTPLDDPLVEGNEFAELTLELATEGVYTVGTSNVATIVLTDDDVSGVSIAATDMTATEGSPSDATAEFTISIPNPLPADLTVNYAVAGSAVASDYTPALSGSATIPSGATTATLVITPNDDAVVEPDETVIVTLTVGIGYSVTPLSKTASVTIYDNDLTASVTATAPNAVEGGANGEFTVTLSDVSGSDRVVNYTVSGGATPNDDYPALSGSITIPANTTVGTIDVAATDDMLEEDSETVVVTLASGLNYTVAGGPATVSITANDQPVVTLDGTDPSATEAGDIAEMDVKLSTVPKENKTINLLIGGTAINGTDYVTIPATVTVVQGETSATVIVTPIDDVLIEGHETVTATLLAGTGYTIGSPSTVAATIADDDVTGVSIAAIDSTATEGGVDNATFRISIPSAISTDLIVAYEVLSTSTATSDVDYVSIGTSATITAGQTFVDVTVTAVAGDGAEADETVQVELLAGPSYVLSVATSATITIFDQDVVASIVATDNTADEGDTGTFTVTLSAATDSDRIVYYTVVSSADAGTDYTALTGSLTIPALATDGVITINAIDDNLEELAENITVTLSAGTNYVVSTTNFDDTVTIPANDTPVATIVATDDHAAETGDPGLFTINLSKVPMNAKAVSYTTAGTADSSDYTLSLGSPVIVPAGQTSVTMSVEAVNDLLIEGDETLNVTVGATTATVTIADNDQAVVSIAATDPVASETGQTTGEFTVSVSQPPEIPLVINYTVTGTADTTDDAAPDHDLANTGTVTIPALATSATIIVTPETDGIEEGNETVVATLTIGINYLVSTPASSATVTISDEDTDISIAAGADINEGETGQFTVTANSVSAVDRVINFSVTGTAVAPAAVDADHNLADGTVTIPAGATSATINVTATDDDLEEANESIVVTLISGTGYALGSSIASLNILANGAPEAIIAVDQSSITEGGAAAIFTVTLSTVPLNDQVIQFNVGGDVDASDYTLSDTTITISNPNTTGTFTLTAVAEAPGLNELAEDATITLTTDAGSTYTVGAPAAATTTIEANDTPVASVIVDNSPIREAAAPNTATFTVSISPESVENKIINYTITGDTDAGDHDLTNGSVEIPAGQTSASVTLTVTDDNLEEVDEVVFFTISAGTGYTPSATPAITFIEGNDVPEATIVATDSHASESGDTATYSVILSTVPRVAKTVVCLPTVASTASGSDYLPLSGSAVIPQGETVGSITLTAVDDNIIEAPETVVLQLFTNPFSAYSVAAPSTATATIASDDDASIFLRVEDGDYALEDSAPLDDANFIIYMNQPAEYDLDVYYTVGGGTAVSGDDYQSLSGLATILEGQTSVLVPVIPLTDTDPEGDETVVISLAAGDGYVIGTPDQKQVIIADNDIAANLVATIATAVEGGASGILTASLAQPTDKLLVDRTVYYTVNAATSTATAGSDYVALSGSVTIPAGTTSATISVDTLEDNLEEIAETVVVALDAASTYIPAAGSATVTIQANDAPEATITVNTPTITEGGAAAEFTVTLSTVPLNDQVIQFSVGGDVDASDYTLSATSITISNPDTAGTFTLTADAEASGLGEPDEDAIVTLTTIAGSTYTLGTPASATTTILANEEPVVASVTVAPAGDIAEGDTATFTFNLNNAATTDTVINYTVTGVEAADYQPVSGSVTIAQNTTSTTLNIITIDDNLEEADEALTVTVVAGTGYTGTPSATKTILANDTPVATIVATDGNASEAGDPALLTINLDKIPMNNKSIVYTTGGTAVAGDYVLSAGSPVTIVAGQTSATISVNAVDDLLVEGIETLTVTVGTTTAIVTIADNDKTIVSIAATDAIATEDGTTTGTFTVSVSQASQVPLVVNYTVTGSADTTDEAAPDHNLANAGTVTIPALATSAPITVTPATDAAVEGNETVVVTLNIGVNYLVSTPASSDTVIITDDDTLVTIAAGADINEGETGQFTVTAGSVSAVDRVISYTVDTTVDPNTASLADHSLLATGSVTIPANQTTATINVAAADDDLEELVETISVTVIDGSGYNVSTIPPEEASLNILANDTPEATITVNTPTITEGGAAATFTVTLSTVPRLAQAVQFNVSGDVVASDYTLSDTTITISSPATSGTFTLTAAAEAGGLGEPDEDVTITLATDAGSTYTLGAPNAATTTIVANGTPEASVVVNNVSIDETASPTTATFTVSLSNPASEETVVSYTITGDTDSGDHGLTSGAVTFPIGDVSETIVLTVTDDNLEELDEDVVFTIVAGTGYTVAPVTAVPPAIEVSVATTTIAANDTPVASIVATDGNASEAGDPALLTISLDKIPMAAKTVVYEITTNTPGAAADHDFVDGGSVIMPAGSTSATVTVNAVDDLLIEGPETLVVSLRAPIAGAGYTIDTTSASIAIADNDVVIVSIAATDPVASEDGLTTGTFTVSVSQTAEIPLVVNYTVDALVANFASPGTDYTALSGTVTIPANTPSAPITVTPLPDTDNEGNEIVDVTLNFGTNYLVSTPGANAQVIISDSDTPVTIAAGADINEGETGQFTVTASSVSGVDRVINYTVDTTVDPNTASLADHSLLATGSVTIPANQTTATFSVTAVDDNIEELNEAITVTIVDASGYFAAGTSIDSLNILANDVPEATITVTPVSIVEDPLGVNEATFTISLSTETREAKTINYTVTGTADVAVPAPVAPPAGASLIPPPSGDHNLLASGSLSIAQGINPSGTITLTAVDDLIGELDETVTVTLVAATTTPYTIGTPDSQTVTITENDEPEASVVVNNATVNETDANPAATFTVSLSNEADEDKVINYTITGIADSGDHDLVSGSVTINAGLLTADIELNVTDDNLEEIAEDVVFTIVAGTGYTPAAVDPIVATTTITANDTPAVSIAVIDAHASEAGDLAEYEVTLSTVPREDKTINYAVNAASTAALTDHQTLSGNLVVAQGATTGSIILTAVDDELIEDPETVVLEVVANPGSVYTVGAPNTATATIADDDVIVVSIDTTLTDNTATEASDPLAPVPPAPADVPTASFTIVTPIAPSTDITVNYTVTGRTAPAEPADHDATDSDVVTTGSVVLASGNTSTTVIIEAFDDDLEEFDEVFDIAITVGYGYVVALPNTETFTILENDIPTASIEATDNTAMEDPINAADPAITAEDRQAIYTVTLDRVPQNTKTVTYNVTAGGTVNILHGDEDNFTFEPGQEATDIDVPVFSLVTGPGKSFNGGAFETFAPIPEANVQSITLEMSINRWTYSPTPRDGAGTNVIRLDGLAVPTAGFIDQFTTAHNSGVETKTVSLDPSFFGILSDGAVSLAGTNLSQAPISGLWFYVDYVKMTVTTKGATAADHNLGTTGTVVFNPGETTKDIVLTPVNDIADEGDEDVTLTLTTATSSGTNPYLVAASPDDSDFATIYDNDATATVYNDTADDTVNEENADTTVEFTVELSTVSARDRVISYSIGETTSPTSAGPNDGLVMEGSDYTAIVTKEVTIPGGSIDATFDVEILADTDIEPDEDLTVTIEPGELSYDPDGADDTVTIYDDDNEIKIELQYAANRFEENAFVGTLGYLDFTLTASFPSGRNREITYNNLTSIAIFNSDYEQVGGGPWLGSVTLPATNTIIGIAFDMLNDTDVELDETFTINLENGATYNVAASPDNSATYVILDDDNVATVAPDIATTNEEDADTITYTVALTHPSDRDRTVTFTQSASALGIAGAGSDYSTIAPSSITIPANADPAEATFTTTVNDDITEEADENIVITLVDDTTYDATATPDTAVTTIYDDDNIVTITVDIDPTNEEDADTLTYTVTATNPSARDRVVSFTVDAGDTTEFSDFDYPVLTAKEVTIPGHATNNFGTFQVDITNDTDIEFDEDLIVTVTDGTSYDGTATPTATTTIRDDDNEATIVASAATTNEEDTDTITYTVTLTNPSERDRTVSFAFVGAQPAEASDFQDIDPQTITIAADADPAQATFTIDILQDTVEERDEDLTVRLTDTTTDSYALASPNVDAVTTIFDDDNVVIVDVDTATTLEPDTDILTFTFGATHPSGRDRVISFTKTGNTVGSDYNPGFPGTITIPASATINAVSFSTTVVEDTTSEPDETIIITIVDDTTYDATATPDTATATIYDDDNQIIVSTIANPAEEPTTAANADATNGLFRVTFDFPSARPRSATYTVSGSATAGTDYTTLSGTANVAGGSATGNITVAPLYDTIRDDFEVVTVLLDEPQAGELGLVVAGDQDSASLLINDPTAGITVTPTSITTTEDGGTATFDVVLDSEPLNPVTITISGLDATEGILSTTTLLFNPTATGAPLWSTPQTVMVTGVNDTLNDGDIVYSLGFASDANADPKYDSISYTDSVSVTNSDEDYTLTTAYTTDAVAGGPGGSITPATGTTIVDGTTAYPITATAADGYTFVNWTGDTGALANPSAASTTVNAGTSSDISVTANFVTNTVAIEAADITVAEGTTGTVLAVRLTAEPSAQVTVNLPVGTGDASITRGATTSLTFDPDGGANPWNVYRNFTLDAAEDNSDTADGTTDFTLSATGHASAIADNTITATEEDDDITVTITTTAGGSTTPSGIVTMDTTLTNAVSATAAANNHFTGWTDASGILADDAAASTDVIAGASDTVHPATAAAITANFDTSTLVVSITEASINEDGGTATSLARVTRKSTDTSGALLVTLSGDTTEVSMPANVTILDTEEFVEFTITAVDDAIVDGTITVTVTASAPNHTNGTATIDVADDAYTLTVIAGTGANPATITATGLVDPDATNSVTAEPLAGYAIDAPTAVWTVTVPPVTGPADLATPVADTTEVDATANLTLTATYAANAVEVLASPTALVPEGGSFDVTDVKLSLQPTGTVTVNVSRTAGDTHITVDAATTTLTFTTGNWMNPQTVTLNAAEDGDDIDNDATITLTPDLGYTGTTIIATEVDDDFTLTVLSGGNGTAGPSASINVDTSSLPSLTATPAAGYHFLNWTVGAGVTLDDPNSATPTLTGMTADATVTANFEINAVAIVAADDIVVEGSSNTFAITLSNQPTGSVTVQISKTAGDPDLTLATDPVSLTFDPTGANAWNVPQNITINAGEDGDTTGDSATFTATVIVDGHGAGGLILDKVITATEVDNDVANGSLTFTSSAFSVNESTTTIDITVSRIGGTTGLVRVDYTDLVTGTATPGSALPLGPGEDYYVAGLDAYPGGIGTLEWSNLDDADKTITITISNDALSEVGGETVSLELLNAQGSATIGQATATLSIVDNDFSLTLVDDGNGSITTPASSPIVVDIATGLPVNLVASPKAGYVFDSWSTTGPVTVVGNQITAVTGNASVTANFVSSTKDFTNAGQTGISGPSQAQVDAAYSGTPLDGLVTVVNGIQEWTVPTTGTYTISAAGASGGFVPGAPGGRGREITITTTLTAGHVIRVLVGQEGGRARFSPGPDGLGYAGGGGGGTFIINQTTGTPILICGGGGGAGQGSGSYAVVYPGFDASNYNVTSGQDGLGFYGSGHGLGGTAGNGGGAVWGSAGGGGYISNGVFGYYSGNIGLAYSNGGLGGTNILYSGTSTLDEAGGFGGGAGVGYHYWFEANGGGGGGYSGGGGGGNRVGAGGGGGNLTTGSYISDSLNTGHGFATFTFGP